MNGRDLALGLVGALALTGIVRKRGSRTHTQSYLRGRCYALALALHKDTGAATWGMFDASGAMHHAFIVRADGLAVDARGLRVVDQVGEGSSVENPTFRPVTVAEIADTAFLNNVVGDPPRWRDPEIREARAFATNHGLIALALAGRSRGSATRRPPLDYDALATAFRDWLKTLSSPMKIKRELPRWAHANGLTYLGSGSQRAVFGVPKGALKIAYNKSGFVANRTEAEVWKDAPADLRQYLVPVIQDSGAGVGEGAWLLMERVICTTHGNMPPETQKRLLDCGINDIVCQNLSDDGRLLDYANVDRKLWAPCATPGTPTSYGPLSLREVAPSLIKELSDARRRVKETPRRPL